MASAAGRTTYHNVVANPAVELWAAGRGGPYTAREAAGDEYERLWELASAMYDGYDRYQELCADDRRIPLIVCEPLE